MKFIHVTAAQKFFGCVRFAPEPESIAGKRFVRFLECPAPSEDLLTKSLGSRRAIVVKAPLNAY